MIKNKKNVFKKSRLCLRITDTEAFTGNYKEPECVTSKKKMTIK